MYSLIKNANTNMTSFQGQLKARYSDLVEIFGEPTYDTPSGDNKVSTEWNMKFIDETENSREIEATIYDWKECDEGLRCRNDVPYDWHIGGHDPRAFYAVREFFESNFEVA